MGRVRLLHHQRIQRQRQRRIGAQCHQFAGNPCLIRVLDQRIAAFRGLHRRRGGQHRFQIAKFADQLRRTLRANARHARNVVGRIADQRLHLDHLVRRDAELFHHLGGTDRLLLQRIHHDHAGPDQLHQVLVGRHDRGPPALVLGRLGIGGDQIVGLPVRQFDGGNAECFGRLAGQDELRDQFLRRRRAIALCRRRTADCGTCGGRHRRSRRCGCRCGPSAAAPACW